MSEKIYIYALCDPRTHEVRYVGVSKNPQKRYYQHVNIKVIKKENTHKCNWIKNVLSFGLKPSLSIIDIANKFNWKEKEQYWIGMFPNLTNSAVGGNGGIHNDCNLKGEKHPSAKFNIKQVKLIIDLYRYTNLSCEDISKYTKTSKGSIQSIVSGKTWKTLSGGKITSLFDKQKYFYGENSHLTKLNCEKVKLIVDLYKYTNLPIKKISTLSGLSVGCIEGIVRGKTWVNITGGELISLFEHYRPKTKNINEEIKQLVLTDIKENDFYLKEISVKYDISVETVRRIKKNNNVFKRKFKHPNSILTDKNVEKIIELYKHTNLSCSDLSIIFKINKSTIKNIISGKQWVNVNGGKRTKSFFKKRKHYSFNSKLNVKDVIEIKDLINHGIKLKDIAKQYNIDQSIIGKIKNGKLWKYV